MPGAGAGPGKDKRVWTGLTKSKDFSNITGPTMIINGTIINSLANDSYQVRKDNVTLVNSSLQHQLQIFQLVIASAVLFLGTIGNGLVIWFCFRMEKTVNVIWFLNLAIADFMFAMSLPFIIASIALDYHWPFGNFMCKFIWFLFFLNMATSVLQLMVISVDRCVIVVFPVWSHNHRTRRLALAVVLIIWVISSALTLPSYILRYTIGADNISCVRQAGGNWVPMARFFLFFLVPFIVIILCYTAIVLRIKDKNIIKSSKPFKIIIALVTAFFICWFPFHLFVLLRIFQPQNTSYFYIIGYEITMGLMLFNSCINPILYVFVGQDFKLNFCGSFQTMLEKAFTEDMDKAHFKKSERRSFFGVTRSSIDTNVM
ncbi:hypothetical protein GDO81_025995 [Engystomops pustulosus]|uniref:G-protein coupled receptors family 1 profile domain-containing protein n=1 Tax=Engystomops pustulosus TaxID=76066 RepID=A0AAV6ZNQ6_ENGPU|nr:hypothetical protein GDO81_025995 [Engystomops pustulosus]